MSVAFKGLAIFQERWRGGEVERWRGGEVERWRGGEVERWRGGEVERHLVMFVLVIKNEPSSHYDFLSRAV